MLHCNNFAVLRFFLCIPRILCFINRCKAVNAVRESNYAFKMLGATPSSLVWTATVLRFQMLLLPDFQDKVSSLAPNGASSPAPGSLARRINRMLPSSRWMNTATATAGLKNKRKLQAAQIIGAPRVGGVMDFPQRGQWWNCREGCMMRGRRDGLFRSLVF